jgi:hypothetical protein
MKYMIAIHAAAAPLLKCSRSHRPFCPFELRELKFASDMTTKEPQTMKYFTDPQLVRGMAIKEPWKGLDDENRRRAGLA